MAQMNVEIPVHLVADPQVVRVGDTLIVRTSSRLTAQDEYELHTRLTAELPGVRVLILDGIDQLLVHRPDEPREAVTL